MTLAPGQFEWIGSFDDLENVLTPSALGIDDPVQAAVLDIGCGTSTAGLRLARKWNCKCLVSLDCDARAIRQMHENFGGHTNLGAGSQSSRTPKAAVADAPIASVASRQEASTSAASTASASAASSSSICCEEAAGTACDSATAGPTLYWLEGDVTACEDVLARAGPPVTVTEGRLVPFSQFQVILDKGTCDYMLAQYGSVWQLTTQILRLLAPKGVYAVVSIFPAPLIKELFQIPGVPVDVTTITAAPTVTSGESSDPLHVTIVRSIGVQLQNASKIPGYPGPAANSPGQAVGGAISSTNISSGASASGQPDDLESEFFAVVKRHQSQVLDRWFQERNPLLEPGDVMRIRSDWAALAQTSGGCTVRQAYGILIDSELRSEFSFQDFLEDINNFRHASRSAAVEDAGTGNGKCSNNPWVLETLSPEERAAVERSVWPPPAGENPQETDLFIRRMWFEQFLDFELISAMPADTQAKDTGTCAEPDHTTKLPLIPQPINGPCSLLCALQAHTLRCLGGADAVRQVAPRGAVLDTPPFDDTEEILGKVFCARAEALGVMLFQAASVPACPSLRDVQRAQHSDAMNGVTLRLVVEMSFSPSSPADPARVNSSSSRPSAVLHPEGESATDVPHTYSVNSIRVARFSNVRSPQSAAARLRQYFLGIKETAAPQLSAAALVCVFEPLYSIS
eukprot:INCI7019.2.p1 GENE.INCI7019.2~~INCI7019.2.p1  ORF type:complete len:684 (+),score=92.15 INCI7019.2:384-2435(+)